ncbi:hypothetical protein T01_13804, partial [Trichinella spiralis]
MQMRIAITLPYQHVQRMEQRKCENTDGTKQNSRKQEKRRSENRDDTKLNKRRQRPWDLNSVGLVLGYFERAKLSHSLNTKEIKRGRHEAERGRHKVKLKKTGCAYGYPSVPILLVSAAENSN